MTVTFLTNEDGDRLDGRIDAKAPTIECEVSAPLVTVTDAAAQPAVQLVSHIEPVQSGSGDPSPDNVRPISGWDKVTAKRTGKNLYSGGDLNFVRVKVIEFDKPLPPGTYTLGALTATDDTNETFSTVTALKADDTSMGSYYFERGQYGVMTLTLPEPCYALRFYASNNFANSSGDTCTWSDIMFVAGEATEYIPYQGQTLTAELPETVYGGSLDWNTGVLTDEWEMYEIDGTETIKITNISNNNRFDINSNRTLPKEKNWVAYQMSTHFVADGRPIGDNAFNKHIGAYSGKIYLRYDEMSTIDELKAYFAAQKAAGTPVKIAYKVATPTTIQLTSQQLETLKGSNNVWSDCGSTDITYIADTKLYIDNKFNELQNAILAQGANI